MKRRKKIKIRKWMVADEGEPVSVYDFKGDAIASAEALNDAAVRAYAIDHDIDIDDIDDCEEYSELAIAAEPTAAVFPFFPDEVKAADDPITLISIDGDECDFSADEIWDVM